MWQDKLTEEFVKGHVTQEVQVPSLKTSKLYLNPIFISEGKAKGHLKLKYSSSS